MKIEISWVLQTDGDFGVSDKEKFGLISTYWGREELIGKIEITEESKKLCVFRALKLLEDMDKDVSFDEFSEMIAPIIRFVKRGKAGAICNTMSGNYDGTCMIVIISE